LTQRIAKYEVVEKIAEGGFGVVYKARDPFIKRLVAIKTCSVADQEMARRFFREAEIAGRFDHPNVTVVHDFGVEGQIAYLVQEYLSGEDLVLKIRRRDPIPLVQKVDWLLQVASGLAYAHAKQVIHRDIKPANLRVLETGVVKILDFGIAKLVSGATQLTQKGVAVGTLGYLSPEQLRDHELDTRTDVFSYGVVAHELLTYTKPFQGKQLSVLMDEILNREAPAVSSLVPEAPPALDRVVARCLVKDRDARYQSFVEVLADLRAVRRELGGSEPISLFEDATLTGYPLLPAPPGPPAAPPALEESTRPVPLAVGTDSPTVSSGVADLVAALGSPAPGPVSVGTAAPPLPQPAPSPPAPGVTSPHAPAWSAPPPPVVAVGPSPQPGDPTAAAAPMWAVAPRASAPAATPPVPAPPPPLPPVSAVAETPPAPQPTGPAPAPVPASSPLPGLPRPLPLSSLPPAVLPPAAAPPPAPPGRAAGPPAPPVARPVPPPAPAPPAPPRQAAPAITPAAAAGPSSSPDVLPALELEPMAPSPGATAPAAPSAAAGALPSRTPQRTGPVAPAAAPAAAVAPSPPRQRTSPRWLLPVLAGLAGVALLGLAAFLTWQAVKGGRPPVAAEAPPVPRPTLAAPVTADEARIVVLANPWGELAELRSAEGETLELPSSRETPLLLTLPPGRYTLTLIHPDAEQPVTCEVEAALGETVACRAEILPLGPMDYFREAGWWQ
jgi:serine/threonine-protein kinase